MKTRISIGLSFSAKLEVQPSDEYLLARNLYRETSANFSKLSILCFNKQLDCVILVYIQSQDIKFTEFI